MYYIEKNNYKILSNGLYSVAEGFHEEDDYFSKLNSSIVLLL